MSEKIDVTVLWPTGRGGYSPVQLRVDKGVIVFRVPTNRGEAGDEESLVAINDIACAVEAAEIDHEVLYGDSHTTPDQVIDVVMVSGKSGKRRGDFRRDSRHTPTRR